ncbi:endosialin-like [Leucoraja erinacea]|uniref:endosialin-like n=1 Tax=Leucoraja erinaceus TaxID=7782 RepID=UPI00245442B7|nr:endosialin-like [Leucoraja erinacea]
MYLMLGRGREGGESGISHAICGPDCCYTVHLKRRPFGQAWRACRTLGGNLASVRRPEDAALLEELLVALGVPGPAGFGGPPLLLWLGLQRQPRQCSPHKPLLGFTWTTGDQETQYTNWVDSTPTCAAPRCVALTLGGPRDTDYKWVPGPCQLPLDGYICRHSFPGLCPGIAAPGTVSYAAPFGPVSAPLRFAPVGTVATVRCPGTGTGGSLLCMARPGGVGWSRGPPLLWGGERGDCVPTRRGRLRVIAVWATRWRRCGWVAVAGGSSTCQDVDECRFHGSCQQMCLNYMGSFKCHCEEGYLLDTDGFSCLPLPTPAAKPTPLTPTTPNPTPPPNPQGQVGEGEGGQGEVVVASSGPGRPPEGRWLPVALLVPVGIFVAVMLALGIAYCTRRMCGREGTNAGCSQRPAPTDPRNTPAGTNAGHATNAGVNLEPPNLGVVAPGRCKDVCCV